MLSGPAAPEPGLRARKAAKTRLAIVAALWRRLADTKLSDISADELAADAGVSRMTFFNYFPTKREAVDFLMVMHQFEMQVTVAREGLRGREAIERVFSIHGDAIAEAPQRMRRVYAHFATRPADVPPPALGWAEQLQLAPDLERELEPIGLGRLFMRLVEEARDDGLPIVGSAYEVAHFLGSLLHGACLVGAAPADATDYRRLFQRHVRRALGLLGAEGERDPAPPRIPAKYRTTRGGLDDC